MIDKKLQKRLVNWLESPADSRNIEEGATILLKINRNQIMYRNALTNPSKYAPHIEYQLRKYYNKDVVEVTHEQVERMAQQVERIAERHLVFEESNPANEFKKGKREDHDSLPEDIQALYVENLSIVQRMREVHARLRILTGQPGICPDGDRYPFLKELIELDKQLHDNWARYDSFDPEKEEQIITLDAREASRKALGFINLFKGRYSNNPTDEMREKLATAYAKVINPTVKLTSELRDLGIIK